MSDEILFQEPGVTIAYDDHTGALAPYGPSVRPNGDLNHGFFDLRDRPELIEQIPEVAASPGFQKLLVAINRHGSSLMSLGCERGFFDGSQAALPRYVGSYTTIVFRDLERNRSKEDLVELAHAIWRDFKNQPDPGEDRFISIEMIVEPLKYLFHVNDALSLNLKIIAHGRDDTNAAETWEWAASGFAKTISAF